MVRLIYNLLWPIGLLFFLPRYLVKMFRRGGYRESFGQRLAFYAPEVAQRRFAHPNPTWIHAVSVGEIAIALKVAHQLRRLEPELQCVLTTTTTTGFAFARGRAPDWIEVMYMPVDFWPIMRRAFGTIQPKRIVLVEGEVWPNLMARAKKSGVPVALVNARLSPRSERRFVRFRHYVAPVFQQLDLVCVPTQEDVRKWRALGVVREKIHHTGSIKYDPAEMQKPPKDEEIRLFHLRPGDPDNPVLLGGSTHSGEEEILARVFRRLREKFPTLTLVIAPRHVERIDQIQRKLEAMPFVVRRKSQRESHAQDRPDCVLLDTTGELSVWYRIASIAFVGKSLTAHGGQNPVEPIVARVPVMFGPNMENFEPLASQLVAHHGAVSVRNENDLEQAADNLLRNADARRRLVASAEEVLAQHRDATRRTAELVVNLATG
jgi:3-deoxy-D-manno-octulosonic-acid transferase